MPKPIVSEQWSQVGVSLLLTLIDQEIVQGPDRQEEVTAAVYALRHLAFRWSFDWPALITEVEARFNHMMSEEEP